MAVAFTGCDELDDVTFSTTLEEVIAVDESSTAENVSYSESIVIDATTDSDIEKYKEKIKQVTITQVEFTVEDYTGPTDCMLDGTVSFGDTSGGTASVVLTLSDVNLEDLATSGEAMTLDIDADDLAAIATLVEDDQAFTIYISGTLSETPLTCNIRVKVYVSVTADALS